MAEQNEGAVVKKDHELKPGAPYYTPQQGTGQQGDMEPTQFGDGPPNEPRKDDPAEGRRDVG